MKGIAAYQYSVAHNRTATARAPAPKAPTPHARRTSVLSVVRMAALAIFIQFPKHPDGLSVVRSYRPSDGLTAIDLLLRVPARPAALAIAVSVRDSSGREVVSRSWRSTRRAPAEHLAFVVGPGRYAAVVTLTDSSTGSLERDSLSVEAFRQAPGASDLLLATAARRATDASDTIARPGELRRGPLFLMAPGKPLLPSSSPVLTYYLELYGDRANRVLVSTRVLTPSGIQVWALPPNPRAVEGSAFIDGRIELSGLAPGRYRFELTATVADSQLIRTADFEISGLEPPIADWPASLDEPALDQAYQPLIYLMAAGEQGLYSSLSVEGKRAWLRRFWARRDPTPETARNEERERFYLAVDEANRRFEEGGAAAIQGWRTDRGRIYIKHGPPASSIVRRPATGSALPYEIWFYSRGHMTYVFVDMTRYGNYALIYTNDARERSWPNWQALLGPEGIKDLERND